MANLSRNARRVKRHKRIRNKISGTPTCPRLSVFKSNTSLYAQIIDDVNGKTLVSASTKSMNAPKTIEGAKQLGTEIAKLAAEAKIENVVFDRSGYVYHGRIEAIATAAREAGLKF